MKIILAHNHYDDEHLANVWHEMKSLGAPTIKAAWLSVYNAWMALEGCHRIRAAYMLGKMPVIEEVAFEDIFDADLSELDWLDFEAPITGEQFLDDVHNRKMMEFEEYEG